MARQARTRKPKEKFSKGRIFTCKKCGVITNEFHPASINGRIVTVCSKCNPST